MAFDIGLRLCTTILSFSVIGSAVYAGLCKWIRVRTVQDIKKISACFICGLKKTTCGKTEFKRHINTEHEIWRYLDCINMVLNKKLDDGFLTMSSNEQYISESFIEENLSWIPTSP